MSITNTSPTSLNPTSLTTIQKTKNKRTILPKKSLIQLYIKTPEVKTQATSFNFKTIDNPKSSGSPSTKPSKKQYNLIRPGPFSLENFEPNQNQFSLKDYNFSSSVNSSSQNQKGSYPKKCVKEKKIQEITRMYLDESNKLRQHLSIGRASFKLDDDASQSREYENVYRKKQSAILNHLAKEFFLGNILIFAENKVFFNA
jgi:hypothetical protein